MKVYKTKEYRIMSVTSGKLLTANEDQLITVEAADERRTGNSSQKKTAAIVSSAQKAKK